MGVSSFIYYKDQGSDFIALKITVNVLYDIKEAQ